MAVTRVEQKVATMALTMVGRKVDSMVERSVVLKVACLAVQWAGNSAG